MSGFDPDTFMQQNVDQPLETEYVLVPQGEYVARIGDFTSDAFERIDFDYKRGARAGTPGVMHKFNCPFIIQDEAVKAELQRDEVTIFKQIILDLNDDGGLDFGKNRNIDLGRIRAAVGQNDAGPWSIARLRGAGPVMVKVVHVDFERKDKTRGKRAEIERVVRIA